jgi:hypothetical protein
LVVLSGPAEYTEVEHSSSFLPELICQFGSLVSDSIPACTFMRKPSWVLEVHHYFDVVK